MRKKLLCFLVLVMCISIVAVFSFIGCTQAKETSTKEETSTEQEVTEETSTEGKVAEETSTEEETKDTLKMVYIVKTADNPYWESMIQGAEEAGKVLNIEIEGLAPITPYSVEEQIRFMEDAITKGVDAIIIVPADSQGIVPGIEKANEAGIPVVTPNTRALGGDVVCWMGYGYPQAMHDVVEYSLSQLEMNDPKIVILEGKAGNQVTNEARDGIQQALDESDKNIEILSSQPADYSRALGQTVMENMLSQFPEIDYVLSYNDEMALGAIEAIDAAGRSDEMIVSGSNGNNDALNAIKDGKLLASALQRPDAQAYWGVVTAYMYIKGFDTPKEFYLSSPLITRDNIDEFFQYGY